MHGNSCWLWFGLLAVCVPAMEAQSASNAFFDETKVQQISLTVNPNDWATLRQNVLQNTYYHAQFTWNGISMDVGIRQHGGATRSAVKPNLDVNIAHYEKSQQFLGINFFLLKANNGDPSNLREFIAMKFYRVMGLTAPREAPAQLYVNGQLFGYFTIVEHLDTIFLSRNYGENGGYLYEWEDYAPYYWTVLGTDPSVYSPYLDLKTNQDSPDLANFAAMVNAINDSSDANFIAAISPYLNPAAYLEYAALDNFLSDVDGILYSDAGINNFYLYQFQGSTLYSFLPWDADETFMTPQEPILSGTTNDILVTRLLNIPAYRGIFLTTTARAAQVFGGANGWAAQELSSELNVMSAAATNDPNKQCVVNQPPPGPCPANAFQSGVSSLQTFISGRASSVSSQLASMSYQSIINQPSITSLGSVSNGSLVPGTLAVLTGQNLGTAATASNGGFARVLRQTFVTVNGERAPLNSVAPGRIIFQLPNDTVPGAASVVVSVNGVLSANYAANIPDTPSLPAGDTLLDIDVPGPSQPFLGTVQFSGWAASLTSSISRLEVAVDGLNLGQAQYPLVRNDVCSSYAAPGCPGIGWAFSLDTTPLANGNHTFTITSTDGTGAQTALTAVFAVANWTGPVGDPTAVTIDRPAASSPAFSGSAWFGGWAIDSLSPIATVSLTVDGIPAGIISYGAPRPDVCAAHSNVPGCPNVGWNAAVDTTLFGDGVHTLAATATSTGGQSTTATAQFTIANQTASNPLH